MGDPHRDLEHLRQLATANPTQRFGKLLKIIRQESFLDMVWQQIRAHKGSRTPGVDGQTKAEVDAHLLHTLAHELATRQYRPRPVLARFKARVKELTRRNQGRSLGQVIATLSAYLRGWIGYFGFCQTSKVLRDLDSWIRHRLRCLQWKQ